MSKTSEGSVTQEGQTADRARTHGTKPDQKAGRRVLFLLYSSEYVVTLQEEFCSELPQVSTETSSQLEEPLQLRELQAALQSMQGRRAPDIDGLTVEAVLTLLPKKGNLQDIKNWRPVSLLCVDYKLLSKALANRLRGAMEQVIHRDQTYCVPGRSMVDNVYLIRDVLEVSSSLGIDTGLISLDQENAFDRVERNFLWKVMERATNTWKQARHQQQHHSWPDGGTLQIQDPEPCGRR
ncbi:hypothetical protein L3Q82_003901 [Scortum barcoo]|uniref:Uncharacterized protein n=1 Tax=Scortum barcoo TaxID=214431 RepID=A0ACB8X693_9TELE|nr:hypothetical protein L3Q82_003901 [Scortum barcoo]